MTQPEAFERERRAKGPAPKMSASARMDAFAAAVGYITIAAALVGAVVYTAIVATHGAF